MRTIEINLYKFDELSEDAQQKVISDLFNINTDHDWWEFIYEDAKNIGLQIKSFDLERNQCEIVLDTDFHNLHQKIFWLHGKKTTTYAIAKRMSVLTAEEIVKELSEAYLQLLKIEYTYLTSFEAIKETIVANEYEFTEDGKLY